MSVCILWTYYSALLLRGAISGTYNHLMEMQKCSRFFPLCIAVLTAMYLIECSHKDVYSKNTIVIYWMSAEQQ